MHSPAPTMFDTESDTEPDTEPDSDIEVEIVAISVVGETGCEAAKPQKGSLRDMREIIDSTSHEPRIVWDLCESGEQNAMDYIRATVASMLDYHTGKKQFVVGITSNPIHRWANSRYGYEKRGFKELRIIVKDDDAGKIANLERIAISFYRRYNPQGILVNPNGHVLCGNRNPGGENAYVGFAPHFLYVAIQ